MAKKTEMPEQPEVKGNKYRDGRWTVPSRRAKGYAEDRKAKVHTYGPTEGKSKREAAELSRKSWKKKEAEV